MPFVYRNSRGREYHLCEVTTKTGKTRAVFSREPLGRPLDAIPPGQELAESVNGQVSLRKAGGSVITAAHVAAVRRVLERHPRLARYAIEAKKDTLTVFEPNFSSYEPVLRFKLIDPGAGTFGAERMCYRSSLEGWLALHDWGPLAPLAAKYVPLLGTEDLFEAW
jgi:hypothetical protein